MFRSTHKLRQAVAGLAAAASLAALTAPSALGSGSPSVLPRSYSTWLAGPRTHPTDGRSPDTRDAALVPREYSTWLAGPQVQVVDGRSPDTLDAAIVAHEPVVTVVESPGFAWGEFGIGIAACIGALLLALALATGVRGARRRPSSAV